MPPDKHGLLHPPPSHRLPKHRAMAAGPKLWQELWPELWLGFQGTHPHDPGVQEIVDLAARGRVQGVVLYANNIENPSQLRHLTSHLRERRPSLGIGVDQEGGWVQRLTVAKGFKGYPSAQEVAATYTPDEATLLYAKMAAELASHGITLNFGPCGDVNPRHLPPSPIIGAYQRSYGQEASSIIPYAAAFVRGHQQVGVKTCLKHFPGHGSAQGDTHEGFVDVTKCWQPEEMTIFKAILATVPVPYIMTAHISHDSWPMQHAPKAPNYANLATFNHELLTGKLRNAYGYRGRIMCDDLHMRAILHHYTLEEAIERAHGAGVNSFIFSYQPQAMAGQSVASAIDLCEIFWKVFGAQSDRGIDK